MTHTPPDNPESEDRRQLMGDKLPSITTLLRRDRLMRRLEMELRERHRIDVLARIGKHR